MTFLAPIKPVAIMGIDPGQSTGIAIATMIDPKTREYTHGQYHYITATCEEPSQVWQMIRPPLDICIVERFAASLIDKYGIMTVELVGGIKALCAEHDISLIVDTPTQRRPYIEYAKSKIPPADGLTRHDQRHEIDALSHVIRWLYQHDHITSLKV